MRNKSCEQSHEDAQSKQFWVLFSQISHPILQHILLSLPSKMYSESIIFWICIKIYNPISHYWHSSSSLAWTIQQASQLETLIFLLLSLSKSIQNPSKGLLSKMVSLCCSKHFNSRPSRWGKNLKSLPWQDSVSLTLSLLPSSTTPVKPALLFFTQCKRVPFPCCFFCLEHFLQFHLLRSCSNGISSAKPFFHTRPSPALHIQLTTLYHSTYYHLTF